MLVSLVGVLSGSVGCRAGATHGRGFTMSKSDTLHCPTCNRAFDPQISPAMPFCSHRCREIDLGRWLEESHGLPTEPAEESDEGVPGW